MATDQPLAEAFGIVLAGISATELPDHSVNLLRVLFMAGAHEILVMIQDGAEPELVIEEVRTFFENYANREEVHALDS